MLKLLEPFLAQVSINLDTKISVTSDTRGTSYLPEMVSSSGECHGLDAGRVKEGPATGSPDRLWRRAQADVILADAALVRFAGSESGNCHRLQFLERSVAAAERFELEKRTGNSN